MSKLIWIGISIGGGIGASLRYALSLIIDYSAFPWATLITNYIGCLLLPFILLLPTLDPNLKKVIGTGMIGSFTTFSTFSTESIELLQSGHSLLFFLYIFVSIAGGLFFSGISYTWMSKQFGSERS
ncbi:CrcB protein [Salinibacillus kushneri]|uniref:Fluoride-specific ion channel FluC n=1 Tax=Salinibacillus kushneri TaxID=237682 RepID=A0A1H9YCI8_9BACI|nr:CrcB family protein [Salinibacillus kushneri]SES66546.1 CrcB protein [Salinibacillus kushneri]